MRTVNQITNKNSLSRRQYNKIIEKGHSADVQANEDIQKPGLFNFYFLTLN